MFWGTTQSVAQRSARLVIPVFAAASLLPISSAHAQKLLEISSNNAYSADVSTVQDVRMDALYRGVSLDGTLLEPAGPWALAANPGTDPWTRSAGRVGAIRLSTWSFDAGVTDLALPAPGFSWTIGRSHNSRQKVISSSTHRDSNGYQGYDWFQASQPEIMFLDATGTSGDTVYLIYGADRFGEFLYKATDQYKAVMGNAGVFKRVSGSPDTWVYYDQRGLKTTFFGGNTASNRANWQLWKIEDPAGNVAYVGDATTASTAVTSGFDTNGRITTAYDTAGRRYTYTYSGSAIGGAIRLTQVKVETKSGGTWASPTGLSEVGRVDYDYYTSDDSGKGLTGDLKLATTTTPLSDSSSSIVRKRYYRYYTSTWSNADGSRGTPHQIKMVLDPDGVRRYDFAANGTLDDDFLTATDADLKAYSAAYLEYVSASDLRVAKAFFNGQCGCGGGTNGIYEFSGDDFVGDAVGYDPEPKDARAIVKQPDGKYVTQYFDTHGQPISRIVTSTDPATSVSTRWVDHVIRNSDAAVFKHLTPAANSSYDHSTKTVTASTTAGDATVNSMITSGVLQGFIQGKRKDVGNPGSPDSTSKYISATIYDSSTRNFEVSSGGQQVNVPVVSAARSYPGSTTNMNDSASYNETTVSTAYWSSTSTDPLYLAVKSETTTFPTVTTANNGSNSATTSVVYSRPDGTTAFTKDVEGRYAYTRYNSLGQVISTIRDVKTSQTSDFDSGDVTNMGSSGWNIATSGGTSASGTHLITSYTYDAQGRVDTVTAPDGRVTKMSYTKLADGRSVTLSIPRMTTGGTTTYYGPVGYTVTNLAGKPEFSATVAISGSGVTTGLSSWVSTSGTDPITALSVGTIARLSVSLYSSDGNRLEETRQYFAIPSSGAGTEGTHYDATRFGYDDMGRQRRVKNPAGTITRTVYDDRGRVTERWIGTNDASFAGGASGTDNMVKVESIEFDSGASSANSLVTKRSGFIDSTTTGRRDTSYLYDDRGRPVVTIAPAAPHTVVKYDNLGRVTAAATYSSSSGLSASTDPESTTTNRLSLSKTFYDQKGQVYESRQYQINQSTGAVVQVSSQDVYLTSLTWFDDAGRPIKTRGSSITKTAYDRLGRTAASYTLASDDDSTYADASTLTGDVVLQESHTAYDDASGTPILSWSVSRRHDDLANGTTGALDSNADGDPLKVTAGNVKGRVSIQAMWYDALNRLTDSALYGTNSIVGDGATDTAHDFNRSGLSVPSRSDSVLVTSTTYDTDGTVLESTDPRGIKTRFEYDKAGHRTKQINNYVDGTPGGGTNNDQDQTVTYQFTSGRMTQMTAVMPSGGGSNQQTIYTYGVTKGTGASDSRITSNDLLWKVQYPDSSGGSDVTASAYNAQGQEVFKSDQAGNVVQTDYDDAGRITHKRVTTLASGFDGAVRRISLTYQPRGLTDLVTQYDNATVGSGSVYNEVKYSYDEWGNVTSIQQDRNSAVASSGGDDVSVQFAYAKVGSGGGLQRTAVRRTGMTLPGGASVAYTYSNSSYSLDDAYGRVTRVSLGGTDVAEYRYLGAGQLVGTALKTTTADTVSNLYGSTGSASYSTYMDAFGRVIKNTWVKNLGTPVTLMDLALAYDRSGNITSVTDGVVSGFDAKYGMDDLNRVIDADEGTLSGGSITSRTRREQWSLSQTGNWLNRKRDLDGDGVYSGGNELNDTGTFNAANEWLTRDTQTSGTPNVTITHDATGNMTDDGQHYTYVYDAFGRMVTVKKRSNSAVVAEYRYDGLGQRVAWHGDFDADGTVESTSDDPWYVFVYDDRWRIVATYRTPTWGGTMDSSPKETFVYHAAGMDGRGSSSYIDSVILRDRDANGGGGWRGASDGTLEERRFYGQNWRSDVVLFMKTTGRPLERIKYSAYGVATLVPGYDYNGDGSINPDDLGDIVTDAASGTPPASADWNLDGTVNTSDSSEFTSDYYALNSTDWSYGDLTLADTGNRKGYAGYELDPLISDYHVRNRVYNPDLGRWTGRNDVAPAARLNTYVVTSGGPRVGASDPTTPTIAQAACGPWTASGTQSYGLVGATREQSRCLCFWGVCQTYTRKCFLGTQTKQSCTSPGSTATCENIVEPPGGMDPNVDCKALCKKTGPGGGINYPGGGAGCPSIPPTTPVTPPPGSPGTVEPIAVVTLPSSTPILCDPWWDPILMKWRTDCPP